MADIFISYARADREKIEKLAAALEQEGYSVWWDKRIEAGSAFSADIERELNAAEVVIVCWSVAANKSDWVKDEASDAREQGKLIPIQLNVERPPMGFRQYQALDMSQWKGGSGKDLEKLLAAIRARLSGEAYEAPPTQQSPPATPIDKRLLSLGAVACLALIVLVIALTRGSGGDEIAVPDSAPQSRISGDFAKPLAQTAMPDRTVLAILPFTNRSPREEDAYFTDGIHDDLLTKLSKISTMQVISRTSVMRFRETDAPISEIANVLGAGIVLEGGVQRAGDRVRINIQLIDASSDRHIWAETYDRELTTENIFDIQEDIARSVATTLRAVLSREDARELDNRPTKSAAAYTAYLRGKLPQVHDTNTEVSEILDSIAHLDVAVRYDPAFAAAYALKAHKELSMFWLWGQGVEWRDRAEESLARAEALAPGSLDVVLVRGWMQYWGYLDYDAAEETFERALDIAPNYIDALAGVTFVKRRRGNFRGSLDSMQLIVKLDPLSVGWSAYYGETLRGVGEFDAAIAAFNKALERDPGFSTIRAFKAYALMMQGDLDSAWQEFEYPVRKTNGIYLTMKIAIARQTRSRANIEKTLAEWPQEMRAVGNYSELYALEKAESLLVLGETQEAEALLSAIEDRLAAKDDPYPSGWATNALYFPVKLPGLKGDLDAVRRETAEFETNRPNDFWALEKTDLALSKALARAGDADAALFYLDRLMEVYGPWRFNQFRAEPAYDSLHGKPGWWALEESYQTWRQQNESADD